MVASFNADNETLDGCERFIHFINAIRDANKGDQAIAGLFDFLGLDYQRDHAVKLLDDLLKMKPLTENQAAALRKILELGSK